jgi:hypothetical protein
MYDFYDVHTEPIFFTPYMYIYALCLLYVTAFNKFHNGQINAYALKIEITILKVFTTDNPFFLYEIILK